MHAKVDSRGGVLFVLRLAVSLLRRLQLPHGSDNGRSPGGGPGESDSLEPHDDVRAGPQRSRMRSVAARLWAAVVERGRVAVGDGGERRREAAQSGQGGARPAMPEKEANNRESLGFFGSIRKV
jgi:hypothetical protein